MDVPVLGPRARAASRRADNRDESLVEQARARAAQALRGREFWTTFPPAAAFACLAASLWAWLPGGGAGADPALVAALVVAYAVAARVQFEVGVALAVPTQLVFVPMLFLVPLADVPALVALGFFASTLPELLRGEWRLDRAALHLLSAWYSLGPVAVLWAAGERAASPGHLPLLAAALAAQLGLDFAISALRACVGLGVSLAALTRMLRPAWLVDAALTPLGLALAVAAHGGGRYAFLLGLPLMILFAHFARAHRSRIDGALELSRAYRGTALLLGDMVEADDAYTGLHSQDVVTLVAAVSRELGLDERSALRAELTALLHDVGKVKIANEIIRKPGPLTPAERALVETHTLEGERMLQKVGGLLGEVGSLVRSCHERWDGTGYPDGLAGESIPVVARIVCACDALSAMTTDRPYRTAMSHGAALDELRRCAGSHFDPRVVAALEAAAAVERPALARPQAA